MKLTKAEDRELKRLWGKMCEVGYLAGKEAERHRELDARDGRPFPRPAGGLEFVNAF
jgi:hypothetical protein